MKQDFVSQAWLVWLLSASVLTLTTRNPLYLLIILLSALIVRNTCGEDQLMRLSFWRLSLVILSFSILFNFLLVHIGQTPILRLPQELWLIGGPLTLEAIIYGATSALILITLLAVFLTFNSLVPASDLVFLAPEAFSNVGIVVLIAVSYVPETLAQFERIREAQALRGHRIRGLRDWQPVIIPLLIGGLERSINLAETMVARGYGATRDEQLSPRTKLLLLIGLLLIFVGWLISIWTAGPGWVPVLMGGILFILVLVELGSKARRTKYRSTQWKAKDWILIIVSVLPVMLVLLPFPRVDYSSLAYSPYPQASMPLFDPFIGLALILLVTPAFLVELSV